jgi:hypothetical protein
MEIAVFLSRAFAAMNAAYHGKAQLPMIPPRRHGFSPLILMIAAPEGGRQPMGNAARVKPAGTEPTEAAADLRRNFLIDHLV